MFNTKILTRTALLLALAIAVQQFKIQWLTGPAINAILILAVGYCGIYSGITIGILTPILAFMQGLMPLLIVVPFIMIGNICLCVGFNWFKNNIPLVGIILGALLKYGFFALAINFLIEVPPKVAHALGIPQLITALTGGIVALVILKYLPFNVIKNND